MNHRYVLSVVAILAVATLGYFVLRPDDAPMVGTESGARSSAEAQPKGRNVDIQKHQQEGAATTKPVASDATEAPLTVASRFNAARDYLEFAKSILDAARAGDRDEQFFLYSALHYCEKEYRGNFRRGKRWLTLDEAMQRASTRPMESADEVREVYNRCHSLHEAGYAEFGEIDEWLAKATAAGQPVALATSAFQRITQAMTAPPTAKASGGQRSPSEMLAEAVRSKDPAVLWTIGELQVALRGYSAATMRSQWAWWLVACQRGHDCSADSPWYKFACRADQLCRPGETAVEYIQRSTENDFPEIEEEAKEINAKLDAGDWEGLGLQS